MIVRIMTWGGIGDILLMTPSLRALKHLDRNVGLEVICIDQHHFDVLRYNPHIDRLDLVPAPLVFPGPISLGHMSATFEGEQYKRLDYGRLFPMVIGRPATRTIAAILGLELADPTLEIFLTEDEEAQARETMAPFNTPVVIHVTSRCSVNQNWSLSMWEQLVRRNPQYTFVQLGLSDEQKIPGSVDLRSRTAIRQSIALIKYAKGFVGVVSSMAHATNAVGAPAVVLFGPSSPEVWSHSNIRPVTKRMRCSPCIDLLGGHACPYGAPCLSEIAVEDVELAVREQIDLLGGSHSQRDKLCG
jgi:ADP-heptose:LPS heptosyltransferase